MKDEPGWQTNIGSRGLARNRSYSESLGELDVRQSEIFSDGSFVMGEFCPGKQLSGKEK